MKFLITAVALSISLQATAAQPASEDMEGTFNDLGNYLLVLGPDGQHQYFDHAAGAAWAEAQTRVNGECKLSNGMTDPRCRRAIYGEYRAAGKLRGEGYCEGNWSGRSEDELKETAVLLTDALKSAPTRSPLQRVDRTKGEVFSGDFNLELRCVLKKLGQQGVSLEDQE